MSGFARSLNFTCVRAYDHDEAAELRSVLTLELHSAVEAFFTNIFRLKRLQQFPADLAVVTMEWSRTLMMVENGDIEASDDSEVESAFRQRILQRYPSQDHPNTALVGSSELLFVIDQTGDRFGLGLHAILTAQVIGVWTACEVLFGDLWEKALNCHPKKLAQLEGMGISKQQAPTIPLWALGNNGFDVSKCMGTLLRDKVTFTSIGAAADAYKKAFPDDAVNSVMASDSLKHLAALRNVLVHKSGKADKEFKDAVASHPAMSIIAIGETIKVSAEIVQATVAPAIEATLELIRAVDNWIVANP